MSKKRREDQANRAASQWTRTHTVIAAVVVAFSAIAAIVVFTIFVGTSFGEDKHSVADDLPALGSPAPIEKSTASDALNKPWDQMSDDEHRLVASEAERVFSNVDFRASSARLVGVDVKIVDGQTQFARSYAALVEPVGDVRFAESLVFYCPDADGNNHAYKYLTTPDGTTLSDLVQPEGTQPWEAIIAHVDWTQPVTDLGFADVDGRRAHGLRLGFLFTDASAPSAKQGDYWFDVESARLLQRQEYLDGQDTSATRYTLQYRSLPPPRIDADQPQPDCVPDLMAKYGSG